MHRLHRDMYSDIISLQLVIQVPLILSYQRIILETKQLLDILCEVSVIHNLKKWYNGFIQIHYWKPPSYLSFHTKI
jgi:hypothetical protein